MSLVIYVFQGEHKNKSEELLRNALEVHVKDQREKSVGFECVDFAEFEVKRTQSGKPFLQGYPFHFSISHTGELWSCLIAPYDVGLDIQKTRKVNFDKLANRFFVDEEIKFVRDNGSDGFFDIWVRKEACIKYLGTGIRDIGTFSVVENGKLMSEISLRGKNSNLADRSIGKDRVCFINAFQLAPDVKGAYCGGIKGTDLWIRELN